MESRLELHAVLENILGSRNVYFNPPESVRMNFPAIVYSRARPETMRANNLLYKQFDAYEVIVIDDDPDSTIVGKVSQLPMCSWDRHYIADNLNHDVFRLYHN